MTGWFDGFARRTAQRAGNAHVSRPGQVSRRRVIAGGSAAVATAWTAPMLMASSAAAVGVSACDATNPLFCPGATIAQSVCCPPNTTCTVVNGQAGCAAVGEPGGNCGNQGVGICRAGFKCNGNLGQCNSCSAPNICGGEGAECCPTGETAQCFGDGLVCDEQLNTGNFFCRKQCTSNAGCTALQVCAPGGFCAEPCRTSSTCAQGSACVTLPGAPPPFVGFCEYKGTGNLTCP